MFILAGSFLNVLKLAMVWPIKIEPQKLLVYEYKMFILPVIFKFLLEKQFPNTTNRIFKLHEMIHENLIDDLICNLDKENCSAGLFFGLSNALDSWKTSLTTWENASHWSQRLDIEMVRVLPDG